MVRRSTTRTGGVLGSLPSFLDFLEDPKHILEVLWWICVVGGLRRDLFGGKVSGGRFGRS
jgi:hypothetical protein